MSRNGAVMISVYTLQKDQDTATVIMVNGEYRMIEVRRVDLDDLRHDKIMLYSTNCENLRIKMTIQAIMRDWVQLNIVDIEGEIADFNIRY